MPSPSALDWQVGDAMNGTLKLGANGMITSLAEIPESEREGPENALLPDGTPIQVCRVVQSVPMCARVHLVRADDSDVWFAVAQEC
jgi:hypothetical protein